MLRELIKNMAIAAKCPYCAAAYTFPPKPLFEAMTKDSFISGADVGHGFLPANGVQTVLHCTKCSGLCLLTDEMQLVKPNVKDLAQIKADKAGWDYMEKDHFGTP